MAAGDKPYRLYRGGRVKGKVPLRAAHATRGEAGATSAAHDRRDARRWRPLDRARVVGVLVLLALVWGVLGYLLVRAAASTRRTSASRRRATAALAQHDGSLLSDPATILVLGTDGGTAPGRGDAKRSDSLMLLRTDPATHRLSYLSIPRDLRVEIPGLRRPSKINAAYQFGGPALAIATVRELTGLPCTTSSSSTSTASRS